MPQAVPCPLFRRCRMLAVAVCRRSVFGTSLLRSSKAAKAVHSGHRSYQNLRPDSSTLWVPMGCPEGSIPLEQFGWSSGKTTQTPRVTGTVVIHALREIIMSCMHPCRPPFKASAAPVCAYCMQRAQKMAEGVICLQSLRCFRSLCTKIRSLTAFYFEP